MLAQVTRAFVVDEFVVVVFPPDFSVQSSSPCLFEDSCDGERRFRLGFRAPCGSRYTSRVLLSLALLSSQSPMLLQLFMRVRREKERVERSPLSLPQSHLDFILSRDLPFLSFPAQTDPMISEE